MAAAKKTKVVLKRSAYVNGKARKIREEVEVTEEVRKELEGFDAIYTDAELEAEAAKAKAEKAAQEEAAKAKAEKAAQEEAAKAAAAQKDAE